MKKLEQVYREILGQAMENKNNVLTQKELSIKLDISLSTVNHALQILRKMNSINVNPRNFTVINPRKILYYWACIRNLEKDIIYKTRVNKEIKEIEKNMPNDIVYTAYSAYKYKFKDVPADYSEVYLYCEDSNEIKRRFPESKNVPNLFVLRKDRNMEGKIATIANIYVDLWNLREWYANEFLKATEVKINAILE